MNIIGSEDDTPTDNPRSRAPGEWANLTTGEHLLVSTVLKRERKSTIWKLLGVASGVIAITQFANVSGPCSTGWKFQTTDAAAKLEAEHADEHASIRAETTTAIQRLEDKVDTGNTNILKAIVDLKTKRK